MKRIMIICCTICLVLTLSAATFADGDVSIAPVFGKITYEDADSNGFSNGTWMGFQLQGEWELPHGLVAQFRYDYGFNDDAVGQDYGWKDLVPDMTTDGKVRNSRWLYNLLYTVGNYRFGLGYLLNNFKETEYGYEEKRDYSGLCLVGDVKLGKDGLTGIGLIYAPSLSVDDHVKGDWDNPDRTASASYDGSYWELNIRHTFVTRDTFSLTGGLNWSELSGDGMAHDEYRFLKHDLTLKDFYVKAEWKFKNP